MDNTIELWEQEIADQKSHYFENLFESIDLLCESANMDTVLLDENIITKTYEIRNTVTKKIKEIIRVFKRYIKELIAKVRIFIQKAFKTNEEKVFKSLCKRVSKMDFTTYMDSDKVKKLSEKFNDVLIDSMDQYKKDHDVNGYKYETYNVYFIKKNGKIFKYVDRIIERINTITVDLDDDELRNSTIGKTSVTLNAGPYLSDTSYIDNNQSKSWYFDSNINLDDAIISNDVPDKTMCDALLKLYEGTYESADAAQKFLEELETGKVAKALESFQKRVEDSKLDDTSAYKLAVKNLTASISGTKKAAAEIVTYALNLEKVERRIRHTFVSLFNTIV